MYFRLWKWCKTKNKFEWFSYLSSKWVIKQQRQLATSTTHLAQELLTDVQCSGGSGSFAKETRALKMRNVAACHQKLTMTDWEPSWKLIRGWQWQAEGIVKADPLTTAHEVDKELNIDHSIVGIWSKLERWKSSVSGCLVSWKKKIIILKCHLLLIYATTILFLNRIVTYDQSGL